MFDTHYSLVYLGSFYSEDENVKRIFKYRFKTQKHTYIVDVEEYKQQIFILKFYLKNHRLSDNRYSFRTNERKAMRILGTCMKISLKIYEKYPLASFGFIGGNDIGEHKSNNKRYRLYKKITENIFSPKKFYHYKDDKSSMYIIFNKENTEIDQKQIIEEISKHYDL